MFATAANPNPRKPRQRLLADPSRHLYLTYRDREIFTLVALHRAATRRQLERKGLFGSTGRANRRLRKLYDGRYLRRTFVAAGPHASQAVYLLGPAAVDIVAAETGEDRAELQRLASADPSRTFVAHALAVLDVRILLEEAAATEGLSLQFLTEPEARHEWFVTPPGRRRESKQVLKPDAYLALTGGDGTYAAFLEVDLGNVAAAQLERSMARYRRYLRDGLFREVYGQDSFEVLFITTGQRRLVHLRELAKPFDTPRFRFTTFEELETGGFLGPVWDEANGERLRLLTEVQLRGGPR